MHRQQRGVGHVETVRAAASVDDRAGADDLRAVLLGDRHRLARRSGGRDDVLDDQDLVVGREREAAAQGQRAVLALGEERAHVERARDFLPDDDAAERGREDAGRAEAPDALAQGRADGLGIARDTGAPARTAGSRGCAALRRGGNAPRAARRSAETGSRGRIRVITRDGSGLPTGLPLV